MTRSTRYNVEGWAALLFAQVFWLVFLFGESAMRWVYLATSLVLFLTASCCFGNAGMAYVLDGMRSRGREPDDD